MRFLPLFLLFTLWCIGKAQGQGTNYPLTLHAQLVPPQSVFISDYAQPGNEQFRLIVTKNDLSSTVYQTRFKFFIKRNGSEVIRLKQNFVVPPTTLDQNPQLLSGVDLSPYFNHLNWDFVGSVNAANYAQTKALPEGFYEFCFVAYDILRPEVAVSAVSCLGVFLSKNDVPLLNTPACGVDLPAKNPQQLVFSWLPRHLSSPGAAQNTEYKFQLFEVRPKGTPANQAVLSSTPVYQETTEQTQIVYGVDKPLLLDTMQYVWRVQALDKTGKDGFQNQGYSQVCTFNYVQALSPAEMVGVPINFTGEAINKQTIQYKWKTNTTDTFDGFRLEYRKAGSTNEWFGKELTALEFVGSEFEANTEYEARLKGKRGERWGEYTPLVVVKTPEDIPAVCGGINNFPIPDQSKPLQSLLPGTILLVRGMDVVITSATGENGRFTGAGKVVTPYLGASFRAKFDNLYIDEKFVVGEGKVEFLTQGIQNFVDNQLDSQEGRQQARQQAQNRLHFAQYEFYGEIFAYNFVIDSVGINIDNGSVSIIGGGQTIVNNTIKALMAANPTKAFVIQDKNGNQWVINPNGGVEKAPSGGLPPPRPASDEEIDLIKAALRKLREEYSPERVTQLEQSFNQKLATLKQLEAQEHANMGVTSSGTLPPPQEIEWKKVENEGWIPSNALTNRSIPYFEMELQINLMTVVMVFALEDNNKAKYTMTANHLKVLNLPLIDYIAQAKAQNKPRETQVEETKQGIVIALTKITKFLIYGIVEE